MSQNDADSKKQQKRQRQMRENMNNSNKRTIQEIKEQEKLRQARQRNSKNKSTNRHYEELREQTIVDAEEAKKRALRKRMEYEQQRNYGSSYQNGQTEHKNGRKKRKKSDYKLTKSNKELYNIAYAFVGIFVVLIIYFIYFLSVSSENVINNPRNSRIDTMSQKIVRGTITSDDGSVLAQTITDDDGNETRVYPYGSLFAHPVGYSTRGTSGIESEANFYLLSSHVDIITKIYNELSEKKSTGDIVKTTLNVNLQQVAYDALGDNQGSVVVLEVSTGKILAMVSKPDYDPNQLGDIWDSLVSADSTESCLVNRATQGLYPPGSTFKLLTALEYMRENPATYEDFRYDCSGVLEFDGHQMACSDHEAHGTVDLGGALTQSCNGAFGTIGLGLNKDSFKAMCETFLFNKSLPIDLYYNKSSFDLDGSSDSFTTAQTSIGQGKTLITPLHNAMIAATIANGGVMMKPYIIDKVISDNNTLVKKYMPSAYGTLMTANEAEKLTEYMISVVNQGTGYKVRGDYQVAAKTGSAEYNSNGDKHAWFIGFAEAENPTIAISVVVEGGGSGGNVAGPIAKQVLDAYFEG